MTMAGACAAVDEAHARVQVSTCCLRPREYATADQAAQTGTAARATLEGPMAP